MTGSRVAWGASAIVLGLLALVRLLLPNDAGPQQAGQIRIADGAAPPTASLAIANEEPIRAVSEPPPLDAEHKAALARELYGLVQSEGRDIVWADRSEAAIIERLRSISDVGRGRPLDVKCATSVCEVSGVAGAEATPETMAIVWDALDRDLAKDDLGGQGLLRATATYGTGRSLQAFAIYFRRTGFSL